MSSSSDTSSPVLLVHSFSSTESDDDDRPYQDWELWAYAFVHAGDEPWDTLHSDCVTNIEVVNDVSFTLDAHYTIARIRELEMPDENAVSYVYVTRQVPFQMIEVHPPLARRQRLAEAAAHNLSIPLGDPLVHFEGGVCYPAFPWIDRVPNDVIAAWTNRR